MFDLTSSKLLILALVALVVVGPKDLPVLLRAIGKYIGLIRRHANEFRSYFDEAMRENDLANLKAEMDAMKRDVQATVSSAGRALEGDINAVKADLEAVKGDVDQSLTGGRPDLDPYVPLGHASKDYRIDDSWADDLGPAAGTAPGTAPGPASDSNGVPAPAASTPDVAGQLPDTVAQTPGHVVPISVANPSPASHSADAAVKVGA
jgi:sec-independent protein translocase protein TatB